MPEKKHSMALRAETLRTRFNDEYMKYILENPVLPVHSLIYLYANGVYTQVEEFGDRLEQISRSVSDMDVNQSGFLNVVVQHWEKKIERQSSAAELYYPDVYPLQYAAAVSPPSFVAELLRRGAELNEGDIYHNNALLIAAMHRRSDIIELLLSNYSSIFEKKKRLETKDINNNNIFMVCIIGPRKIFPHKPDSFPPHPNNTLDKCLDYLLDMRSYVRPPEDIKNDNGETPFFLLTRNNHKNLTTIRRFVSVGARIDIQSDEEPLTPLLAVLERGHYDMARFLIVECGADVNAMANGKTALGFLLDFLKKKCKGGSSGGAAPLSPHAHLLLSASESSCHSGSSKAAINRKRRHISSSSASTGRKQGCNESRVISRREQLGYDGGASSSMIDIFDNERLDGNNENHCTALHIILRILLKIDPDRFLFYRYSEVNTLEQLLQIILYNGIYDYDAFDINDPGIGKSVPMLIFELRHKPKYDLRNGYKVIYNLIIQTLGSSMDAQVRRQRGMLPFWNG